MVLISSLVSGIVRSNCVRCPSFMLWQCDGLGDHPNPSSTTISCIKADLGLCIKIMTPRPIDTHAVLPL
ncbi:hypothetical protein ACN47E_004391 [Coniothyrium glycines]